MAFVGRLVFGEAHVVMDAKDGIFSREIAQGLDCIEAEDEALDEVLEERFGLFVLGAVGFEPFMVIVQAKVVQESEDGLELGHGMDFGLHALDNFHFTSNGVQECIVSSPKGVLTQIIRSKYSIWKIKFYLTCLYSC